MNIQTTAGLASPPTRRIDSIDVLRGIVIVIMVLDHIRDYTHASGYAYDPIDFHHSSLVVYLTRWVTNLCAPTFVFLAGVSAWLQRARGKDAATLSRFLLTRGLWLVVVEVTVIAFAWSFSFPAMELFGVIWAIGWSMVLLAALVWLPRRAVLAVGVALVAGHDLLDPFDTALAARFGPAWDVLHHSNIWSWGGRPQILLGYPLLPWLGVMASGYGIGAWFLDARRDRLLSRLGLAMLAAFLGLRGLDGYGDARAWAEQATTQSTLMDFFNVSKYPPSLDYVLVTLGLVLALFPLVDRLGGRAKALFLTYGSVPLIAYVSHLYVMHALAIGARLVAGQGLGGMFDTWRGFTTEPERFGHTGFPLIISYALWLLTLVIIYPLCRWWGQVKRTRRDWWLSYL